MKAAEAFMGSTAANYKYVAFIKNTNKTPIPQHVDYGADFSKSGEWVEIKSGTVDLKPATNGTPQAGSTSSVFVSKSGGDYRLRVSLSNGTRSEFETTFSPGGDHEWPEVIFADKIYWALYIH